MENTENTEDIPKIKCGRCGYYFKPELRNKRGNYYKCCSLCLKPKTKKQNKQEPIVIEEREPLEPLENPLEPIEPLENPLEPIEPSINEFDIIIELKDNIITNLTNEILDLKKAITDKEIIITNLKKTIEQLNRIKAISPHPSQPSQPSQTQTNTRDDKLEQMIKQMTRNRND